jgi:hypothetical protein
LRRRDKQKDRDIAFLVRDMGGVAAQGRES